MGVVHAGLMELAKLGEINLAGLSHETVMQHAQGAPPMETTGLTTALKVLERYQPMPQTKLAAPRVPYNPDLPQINRLTGAKKKKRKKDAVEHGKSLAAYTLGGMGAGRVAGYLAGGPKAALTHAAKQRAHGKMWWGTAIGAGVGAAEFARKRIAEKLRERKEKAKEAAFKTPALQLKNSRQVGTIGQKTGGTPGFISKPFKI